MINFIALFNSLNRVYFNFDMRLIVNKYFWCMWEKIVDLADWLFIIVLTIFMIFGSFTIIMIFKYSTHF
jgi:hypothetical protein